MSPWLVLAYGALALGLAWVVAGGTPWIWRAPFIVLAPALAVALWLGRPNPAGWPTGSSLPRHASLQWALVDEPDPATGDRGRIYLWLDVGKRAPRAYSLPYSRSLHREVQHALAAVAHGRPMTVALQAAFLRRRGHGASLRHNRIHVYPTPPVRLPPKPSS
jgi:hypothetical protein